MWTVENIAGIRTPKIEFKKKGRLTFKHRSVTHTHEEPPAGQQAGDVEQRPVGPVETVKRAPHHHVTVGLQDLCLFFRLLWPVLVLLQLCELRVEQHGGQARAADVAVARVALQTLRDLTGLTRVLQGEVCQHHLRGVRQRLRRGEGAAVGGRGPAARGRLSADVCQQNTNVQVAAHVGGVAVKAGNDGGQVHRRRNEDCPRLAPVSQVKPRVEVDVERALDELSGRAEHRGDAQGEGLERGRQHKDARAEHGHFTG